MAKIGGLWEHGRVRWRRVIGWSVAAIAVVVVGWALLTEREPRYGGRKMSDWMLEAKVEFDPTKRQSAREALRKIGSKGVPCVMEWIRYEELGWKRRARDLLGRAPRRIVPDRTVYLLGNGKQLERAILAAEMLGSLGPAATNAIPELTMLMNQTNGTDRPLLAVFALGGIGKEALPPLLGALSELKHSNRAEIVTVIGRLGTNASPAMARLVKCLEEPDGQVVVAASRALGNLKLEPEMVIPELTKVLAYKDYRARVASAEALKCFGSTAQVAVPILVEALDDSVPRVRDAAREALQVIAPAELEKDKNRTHKPQLIY